jgi:hypothetical protein
MNKLPITESILRLQGKKIPATARPFERWKHYGPQCPQIQTPSGAKTDAAI